MRVPGPRSLAALLLVAAGPLAGQVITHIDLERLRARAVRVPVIVQSGKAAADTLRRDVDSLRLRPGQVLVAELRDTSHRFLPLLLLAADPRGARPLALRPYVQATPLEFTGTAFRGAVALGLMDTLQPDRVVTLPTRSGSISPPRPAT